ncbi:ABC transporter permease [Frankia sp. CNm7]|uniref:Transport permease protein n=1 Tax=Frankia nepalensis TaxID=1836974 RepID=A0A937UMI5_9ACTN|nr:ABC transporter permease [Frankia nepalensis]MBL7498371.1 ABC transporter permease [Frankia nepalensis]MBL7515662.1 ABC transporter permease [Frankia nepalensis]MBL7524878.1 ABC transporter permease [Frankia nepalensis]MBL7628904.1 ABC transporter permease [Frankia nepalensis]
MRFFSDVRLTYARAFRAVLREPSWIIIGLIQPLFYLYLFGPLLDNGGVTRDLPAGTSSWDFFVPGLLVQLVLFNSAFNGFALLSEMRAGVLERLSVTPISRLALLLGRAGRDATLVVIQGAILVGLAIPLGLHLHSGFAVAALLLLALAVALSCLGYGLALVLRSEDALAPVLQGVTLPVMLLSGIFLPLTFAPAWLDNTAEAIPLRHTTDAVRALMLGSGSYWIGIVVTVALAVVLVTFGARRFNNTEDLRIT